MDPRIRFSHAAWNDAAWGVVTLSRPEKANALDVAMLDCLAEVIRGNGDLPLMLVGRGGYFSAGMDMGELDASVARDGNVDRPLDALRGAFEAVAEHPRVVALVDGAAAGGGAGLAMLCRKVFATSRGMLLIPDGRVRRFAELVLPVLALRGCREDRVEFGGRLTAEDACQLGLIDGLADDWNVPIDWSEADGRAAAAQSLRAGFDKYFAAARSAEAVRFFAEHS